MIETQHPQSYSFSNVQNSHVFLLPQPRLESIWIVVFTRTNRFQIPPRIVVVPTTCHQLTDWLGLGTQPSDCGRLASRFGPWYSCLHILLRTELCWISRLDATEEERVNHLGHVPLTCAISVRRLVVQSWMNVFRDSTQLNFFFRWAFNYASGAEVSRYCLTESWWDVVVVCWLPVGVEGRGWVFVNLE